LALDVARSNRLSVDWAAETVSAPATRGLVVLDHVSLETLEPYIDWTPFFHAWELRGKYPRILEDTVAGPEARKLFDDAQEMLSLWKREGRVRVRGVVGLFPANARGDDIVIWADEARDEERATLHCLRQQRRLPEGRPNLSLICRG